MGWSPTFLKGLGLLFLVFTVSADELRNESNLEEIGQDICLSVAENGVFVPIKKVSQSRVRTSVTADFDPNPYVYKFTPHDGETIVLGAWPANRQHSSGKKDFEINLMAGSPVIRNGKGTAVLHIRSNYNENQLILNSFEDGQPGEEKVLPMPPNLKKGFGFNVKIRAMKDHFKITFRDDEAEAINFDYRVPFNRTTHVNVMGPGLALFWAETYGRSYELPYRAQKPANFEVNNSIRMRGHVYGNTTVKFFNARDEVTYSFTLSLDEKGDIDYTAFNKKHSVGWFSTKNLDDLTVWVVNQPDGILFTTNQRWQTKHKGKKLDWEYMTIDGDFDLTTFDHCEM